MKLNKEQTFLILITLLVITALLTSQALTAPAHAVDRSPGCAEFNRNGSTNNSQQFYSGEVLYVRITVNGGTITQAGIFDHENSVYMKSTSGTFTAGDVITVSYTIPADGSYDLSYGWEPTNSPSVVFSCGSPEDVLALDASGFIINEDGILVQLPVDNRFNWHNGDLFAMIFPGTDSAGNPALNLYCIAGDEGVLGFQVTETDIEAHDESLPQSVPVLEANLCNAAFYVLDDGEYPYQINIWDDEGKLYETLCTDLTCATRISRFIDPHQQ
jgi:hypothetical protein